MRIFLASILLCLTTFVGVAQNKIDIYYLTANAYCPSVEQIETYTKQVVDSLFIAEKLTGKITENKLNIFDEISQDFVHQWEISTNGLIFLVTKGDSKYKVDLNDLAFSNVPSDIIFYKKELEKTIKEILTAQKGLIND